MGDFVADVKPATQIGVVEPTNPDKEELKKLINQYEIRMSKIINNKVSYYSDILDRIKRSYILSNPMSIYEVKEQILLI